MLSSISRNLLRRSLLSSPNLYHRLPLFFSTDQLSDADDSPLSADPTEQEPEPDKRIFHDRVLENGLDTGIYRAILVGRVGQLPVQKTLRSGVVVTLLSVGTGGIRNNRRPFEQENPSDYANRCSVQWHRISVYNIRVGDLLVRNVVPGSLLYVEGNLETKVFADPISGLVRRLREVAVRRNGRVVVLTQGDVADQERPQNQARGAGYYR